ncbi:MAG: serine kinase [Gammaproteobacteria bacterium]|nr:serine kinase [Gammaproteobacteria bacterium]
MKTVFLVQHLHVLPQGEEDVKLIGVYQTREDAQAAVARSREQSGFCDFPKLVDPATDDDAQGFYIDEIVIGMNHFENGYVTV